MRKLLDKIMTRRCDLVVEEDDVIGVLKIINKHHKLVPNMAVGNCGWGDDTKKWFIHFTTTKYKWDLIRTELKIIRVFKNTEIPKNCIGTVYTTD